MAKPALSEARRRMWANPEMRALVCAALKRGRQKRPDILPPMTREQKLLYRKLRKLGFNREAALDGVFKEGDRG